ncbi:hypothetical protein BGZ63DRAFT_402179 [Mariannaea sp. PMI_226]|nr:hypothetical protein BGZ63DRAFT_402179 [Mariannaea sp. PMI_226]
MKFSSLPEIEQSTTAIKAFIARALNRKNSRGVITFVVAIFVLFATWTGYELVLAGGEGISIHAPSLHLGGFSPKPENNDTTTSLIPQKIWQVMLRSVDPHALREMPTWLAKNMDYQYTLLGDKKSDEFVQKNFAKEPRLIEVYSKLQNIGMKVDLLRYLLMYIEGGVYADIDVAAVRPVDTWVPEHLRGTIKLIVGPEFDRLGGGAWAGMPYYVQFGQWTVAAAPRHPVFRTLIDRALQGIEDLIADSGVPIEEFKPSNNNQVLNSTGPIAFTETVFKYMQTFDSNLTDTQNLSAMKESRVYGDVLVLTIDGFGTGQVHSGSSHNGTMPESALVHHKFWSSWTKADQMDHSKDKEEHKEHKREEEYGGEEQTGVEDNKT